MMDTFKTLVIPDDCVELARQLCALEAGGAGMFTTGLSADGKEPATHYISTGWCPPLIAKFTPLQVWEQQEGEWVMVDSIPGNPEAVYKASQAADPPLGWRHWTLLLHPTNADKVRIPRWWCLDGLGQEPVEQLAPMP